MLMNKRYEYLVLLASKRQNSFLQFQRIDANFNNRRCYQLNKFKIINGEL